MSKCTTKDEQFIKDCHTAAYKVLTAWNDGINCRYDADALFAKRDYILQSSHSWGTIQCNWANKKAELFSALKAVGATNIIGKVAWNRIDIAFDISNARLKKDGLEVVKVPVKVNPMEDSAKVEAWHRGDRKINIRACSLGKLVRYNNICIERGYKAESTAIIDEMLRRTAS